MILKNSLLSGSLTFLMSSSLALAASTITSVEMIPSAPDEQKIVIKFDGKAPMPTSFVVGNPPKLSFDFRDTKTKVKTEQLMLNGAYLNSGAIVEADNRTRLILNLNKLSTHTVTSQMNQLTIAIKSPSIETIVEPAVMTTIAPNTPMVATPSTTSVKTTSTFSSSNQISGIDFKKADKSTGRILINIPKNSQSDIKRSGNSLVINLPHTSIPSRLARKLDVSDFDTIVNSISSQNFGSGTQIIVQNKSNNEWDFASYQTDKQLVIEVSQQSGLQAIKNQANLAGPVYKGERLNLHFQDVEVRELLQTIAEFSKFNIIAGDNVGGRLSLRLTNVPWDQALDTILAIKGLEKRRDGNVIYVAPIDDILALTEKNIKKTQVSLQSEPFVTEVFVLKYRPVKEVYDTLKGLLEASKITGISTNSTDKSAAASADSLTNSIQVDPRTNKLIIREKPSVLQQFRETIAVIDVPIRQIMIEARIVEAKDNFQRDLGLKLGFSKTGADTSIGSSYSNGSSSGGTSGPNINLPISLIGGSIAAIYQSASSIIGLELQAMQQQGQGKIVASPRVLTKDRTSATIQEGIKIPYVTISDGAATTSFEQANLILKVNPSIMPNEDILLDIDIKKDTPNLSLVPGGQPAIDTKSVVTQVQVNNGGTIVIGGIFVQEQGNSTDQVPILGDIPVIGRLFKRTSNLDNRREMLIFITPKIVEETQTLN